METIFLFCGPQCSRMCDSEDIHLLLQEKVCGSARGTEKKVQRRVRARTAPSRPVQVEPGRFLKKNQRVRVPPVVDKKEYECVLGSRRPPVPKTIQPITERPQKNFVKKNVEAAGSMETKKPAPITVVTCKGDRRDLTTFLEARQLRESETFGKVPRYLSARRKRWDELNKKRQEELERLKRDEENVMRGYRQISQDDRQKLLAGLKERWMEVHKEFLMLPVLCDTAPKVKRKLQLEKKLAELEKDIELLESNPFIYLDGKGEP